MVALFMASLEFLCVPVLVACSWVCLEFVAMGTHLGVVSMKTKFVSTLLLYSSQYCSHGWRELDMHAFVCVCVCVHPSVTELVHTIISSPSIDRVVTFREYLSHRRAYRMMQWMQHIRIPDGMSSIITTTTWLGTSALHEELHTHSVLP